MAAPDIMEKLVSLCKRRGFIFQSSEIYGGLNGCWDYGPLGVELLNNLKNAWWRSMTLRNDIEGIDAAILMHPRVWEASGHVENFTDPMVDCKECKARFRADQIDEAMCGNKAYKGRKARKCCDEGKFTEARQFNLMFKSYIGPLEDASAIVYLRPETAQGIFVNFPNIQRTTRRKIPFGVCQIGKSFRNEITPGNFIFRTREFEQMEMEFFCKPGTELEWFAYWKRFCREWLLSLGLKEENLRLRDHDAKELSHYSNATTDFEFLFPFGWGELWGVASRTNFDLTQHQNTSGKNLEYFDPESGERYLPFVVEPALGVDRMALAFLCDAYDEEVVDAEKGDTRVVLHLHPALAPVKAAVLPLSKKLGDEAEKICDALAKKFAVEYDDTGSIGKRYRRQDEIGTPFCVTFDFDSLEDGCVTVRERDSMEQIRLPIAELAAHLEKQLGF